MCLSESVRQVSLICCIRESIAVSTVSEYVRYAQDACAMLSLDNFASKFSERETIKKHYFIDNGFLSIFENKGRGALLENLCAIYLYRIYRNRLFYYNKNIEVDFIIPEEGYAVQVAYSVQGDLNTFDRETKVLVKLAERVPVRRMVIVTHDEEQTVEFESGKVIEILPAWKWMLENEI